MIVIVDTREQTPFDFGRFPDVVTRRDTLPTGDYSLAGFESVVACERKEVNDLIACLQNGNRERFERELARGSALHRFCVLVEGTLEDIRNGRYRSQMKPTAALQSLFAFRFQRVENGLEFGIPFRNGYAVAVEQGFYRVHMLLFGRGDALERFVSIEGE